MYKYHGIAVYEIIDNGLILSGICAATYTPTAAIGSDIAIREKGSLDSSATYKTSVMDDNNTTLLHCTLTVTLRPDNVYDFVWEDANNKPIWIGIGLKSGVNRLSVSYSHPPAIITSSVKKL